MTENYATMNQAMLQSLGKLSKTSPDMMSAFTQLSQSANKEGALSLKTKELIAVAIAVAGRCDPCIGFHVQKLVKLGTTQEELVEMLNVAVYMGGGPSLMYAAETLKAFQQLSENK